MRAPITLRTLPLVATSAVATISVRPCDLRCVAGAVGYQTATRVTIWIEAVVSIGAQIAIDGGVVLLGARLTFVSSPLVAALAGAVREEPSDIASQVPSVVVAVDGVGTDAVASREVDVSSGARVAVRFAIVLGGADGAGGSRPAVAALAQAPGVRVALHVLGMAAAVGEVGAGKVAERVGVVARRAHAAVLGAVEVGLARGTRRALPHAAALAGASGVAVAADSGSVSATIGVVRAGEMAMRIRIVACGTCSAILSSIKVVATRPARAATPRVSASALTVAGDTGDTCSVTIAVHIAGAEPIAVRIACVSSGARPTVVGLVVLAFAQAAIRRGPCVAARARAALDAVATDAGSVAVAVGYVCACLVAVRVGAVLLVPCGACATVFGAVVAVAARGTGLTDPRVAAVASAVRF